MYSVGSSEPKTINSIFYALFSQHCLVSAKLTQTRGSLRRVSASKSGRLRCRGCEALSGLNFQNASFTIIEHSGIVVHELDVRHGYRKDNLSENKVQYLSPEAQKGLQEQLAAARGISGPKQCST